MKTENNLTATQAREYASRILNITHAEACAFLGISPRTELTDLAGKTGNGWICVRASFSGGSRHTYDFKPL